MSASRLVAAAALLLVAAAGPAPAQLRTQRIVNQLVAPVWLTAPPGDPDRLFVVEQAGVIRILENDVLVTRPFLDITAIVNDGDFEQGLLGLAFHPQYAQNGFFYVYFTGGTSTGHSEIRRYAVSADPDSADAGSGFPVFRVDQPFFHHNGGHIEFGPDGFLYLGLGDGGGSGDPGNRAQDPMNLLGKMLRLDPDGDDFPADSLQNYAVPPDNPFVGVPGTRDEIWALGFRNPYRFSFDRGSGDLYLGDVGESAREEIDYEPAGGGGGLNYGWRLMEGTLCFHPPTNCNPGGLVLPIHDYDHSSPVCESVTGGAVYRGTALPGFAGTYFFGDYCTDQIWTFRVVAGAVTEFTERTAELDPPGSPTITEITAIAQDAAGELYVLDRGTGGNGEVFRILADSTALPAPEPAAAPAGFRLSAAPTPFTSSTSIHVHLPAPTPDLRVTIHTTAGRRVRVIHAGPAPATTAWTWDGRDDAGRPAAAGIYWIRATDGRRESSTKVQRLR